MASRSALLALLVAVSCAAAASAATTWTVGDTQGWTLGGDYSTWASGKSFAVGDKLVFNYGTGNHDVLEVSKSDYDACNNANALVTNTNGPTTITLDSAGDKYYICGIGSHCSSGGMKLAITVGSGSSPSPSTPGTPTTPTTPTPTTPSSPSPKNAAPAARFAAAPALAVAAGVLIKLALFL